MLVVCKFKEGEAKLKKFIAWMQSGIGIVERAKLDYVEKSIPGILFDRSGIMFKITAHNNDAMMDFLLVEILLLSQFMMNA
jgi:hypothetical protein|tara:strand:+ start:270 stop:512 length:243 start_codon:yes stop_codon:yes gene_type:complete